MMVKIIIYLTYNSLKKIALIPLTSWRSEVRVLYRPPHKLIILLDIFYMSEIIGQLDNRQKLVISGQSMAISRHIYATMTILRESAKWYLAHFWRTYRDARWYNKKVMIA